MEVEEASSEMLAQHQRRKRHKRASTACQRCRAKKIKCDNLRPICGTCRENYAQCVYGSGEESAAGPTIREVYDRVNHIVDLLESRSNSTGATPNAPSGGFARLMAETDGVTAGSLSARQHGSLSPTLPPIRQPTKGSTAAGISFEAILKWPIFRDFVPTRIASLVLQHDENADGWETGAQTPGPLLGAVMSNGDIYDDLDISISAADRDQIRLLCQKYLKDAHVKNPIFNPDRFNSYAKRVLEHGLDWSEGSCIIMLACALASAVQPLAESSSMPVDSKAGVMSSKPKVGHAFYRVAQRRLGSLEVTLASVQCFYLAGLYEVTCLRPANAWIHYNQASSRLQIVMAQQAAAPDRPICDARVAERLYFSCLRTELDLLEELPLPASGITTIPFPNEFPSLPSWASTSINADEDSGRLNPNVTGQDQEQSWFYYLAAIALRKQANSIMDLLYNRGETGWMDGVEYLVRQAALQEHELDTFNALLPAALRTDEESGNPPRGGLAHILQCRHLHWRQISSRPLLYYILHRPNHDPWFSRVCPLAQKCLEYCALTIRRLSRQYRYEAIWFNQRSIASAALLILAAQARRPPLYVHEWKTLVTTALRALAVEGKVAPDIERARSILNHVMTEVSKDHL